MEQIFHTITQHMSIRHQKLKCFREVVMQIRGFFTTLEDILHMLAAVVEAYDTKTRQPGLRSSDGYRTESEITLCWSVEGFASTAFVTSVTTITVTSTSQSLCGKLVNVTGACRRRRNFQFERPEIQTYDDDFDDTIDMALRGSYFRKQFAPTKTLGMEVTPLVVMPPHSIPSGRNPSVVSNHPYGLHYPMYSFDSRSKSPYIHPSLFHHQDEAKLQQQQLLQQQRIFFSALSLASLFNKATVTYTTFRTETKTEVKSGTGSFIVVGCTPSPFPFSICNAKAPLPITITPVG